MKKTCLACGKVFEISEAEINFYEQQKLKVPDKCYACRRAERIRRNAPIVPRGIGRNGKNRFGIGHAMPGMMSILLILAAFMFGRSFLSPGSGTGKKSGDVAVTMSGISSRTYIFRNFDLLAQNFEQYGKAMGYTSAEKYLEAANAVIANPESVHRTEGGEDWYENQKTSEKVIVAADGYIRIFSRIGE